MKYLYFLFLLILGCGNPLVETKRCKIVSVEEFKTPDYPIRMHHRVKTSCGITLYTIEKRNIGDSLTILVFHGNK